MQINHKKQTMAVYTSMYLMLFYFWYLYIEQLLFSPGRVLISYRVLMAFCLLEQIDDKKRISVRKFKGKTYVDIREFYEKDGEQLPGKKGR